LAAEEHVEHTVPKLKIEFLTKVEPFSFCAATSIVTDGVTASSPPTHPAPLSDGGGADVGGVGGHQIQDIDTETAAANPAAVEETTAAGQQTQDAGAGASTVIAAGA
jgi:hypothetical protein